MPSARSNYRVSHVTELASNIIQQTHLQSNIIVASHIVFGGLRSILVIDSMKQSAPNPMTVSMGGYGKPDWLLVVGMSAPATAAGSIAVAAFPTQSFSGSIGWIYVFQSDGNFAATVNVLFLGLIGSR